MSVRMRHTRAHTGNRRSHHGLDEPRTSACANCGTEHLRHRVCSSCGQYRGRTVFDIAAQLQKKEEKRKRRQRELGVAEKKEGDDGDKKEQSLSPEELSKK